MLDSYEVGHYKRQSPEADVPLLHKIKTDNRLGGAGNVAKNLLGLGINPILISITGDDTAGQLLSSLCHDSKIAAELITELDRPTTIKHRVVDENYRQYLRLDTEITTDISMVSETKLRASIDLQVKTRAISGIVIQDYNKGVCSPYMIKYLQELSEKNDIPLFIDPKKDNFSLLAKSCTIFKPNLKELSTAYGNPIKPEAAVIKGVITELQLTSPAQIFITLAEKGIFYYSPKDQKSGIIAGVELDSPDVSGAGDTVLAVLIWAYLKELDIEEQSKVANQAGAAVCKLPGVSVINESLLLRDI